MRQRALRGALLSDKRAFEKENEMSENKAEKILVVIDMQKDFIDGALGTAEAVDIVDNVVDKIKSYDPENVYATRDIHPVDYLQTQEGQNLPVEHCIEGTEGWQLDPKIAPLIREDHIFDKPTFGSTELADKLSSLNDHTPGGIEIELVGLCTDICVVSNALLFKAEMPEVRISADASCCAGVTPEKHEAALATMESCQIHITGGAE